MEYIEIELPLMIGIRFNIQPEERMTRHYPGSPACIEDVEIRMMGCSVPQDLQDKIIMDNQNEIDEACWDHMQECAAENAMMQAEHRHDSIMDR